MVTQGVTRDRRQNTRVSFRGNFHEANNNSRLAYQRTNKNIRPISLSDGADSEARGEQDEMPRTVQSERTHDRTASEVGDREIAGSVSRLAND